MMGPRRLGGDEDGLPRAIELPAGELHVWTLALDVPAETLAAARGQPRREELARFAGGVRPPMAAQRRATARAGLRLLLGRYLGIDPRRVEIVRGARGRPELGSAAGLSFNLSHSADLAVLAIGRQPAIGVDIEAADRRTPTPGLIGRALNAREAERVMRAATDARTGTFLAYWTVKEAYAKALGVGVTLDLREVEVGGSADRPRLEPREGGGGWQVRRLRPRAGVVGAVVANGGPWRMRLRELSLATSDGAGALDYPAQPWQR